MFPRDAVHCGFDFGLIFGVVMSVGVSGIVMRRHSSHSSSSSGSSQLSQSTSWETELLEGLIGIVDAVISSLLVAVVERVVVVFEYVRVAVEFVVMFLEVVGAIVDLPGPIIASSQRHEADAGKCIMGQNHMAKMPALRIERLMRTEGCHVLKGHT